MNTFVCCNIPGPFRDKKYLELLKKNSEALSIGIDNITADL